MTNDELLRLIDEAEADGRPTLDLSGQGLSELPPEIGKLTNLKTLVLGRWDKKEGEARSNHLTTLPDEIEQLTELRSLFLYNNEFDELPEVVGTLKNLRSLDLSSNRLSTLSDIVGELKNLRSISLNGNKLSNLPVSIGKLFSLQSLVAYNNQLNTLPDTIGNLDNLRLLGLSYNQLSNLPVSLSQISHLQALRIRKNIISELPDIFFLLYNLQFLDLSWNGLTTVPDSIGQLSMLRVLSLRGNCLTSLPNSFSRLSNLQLLNLGYNQLQAVPTVLVRLSKLETLSLRGNQLSKNLGTINRLTRLKALSLRDNQLTTITGVVDQLTNLRELYLSANNIITLSESIGHLPNLQKLDLDSNHINALPENVGKLSKLKSLDLHFNQLAALPRNIHELDNLSSLDLSFNQLSTLPESLGKLTRLKSLDLSFNQLSTLPESLGKLTRLKSLDLSANRLSMLPESVKRIKRLEFFSLSDNQLDTLPATVRQLKHLKLLDLRYNQLSVLPSWIRSFTQLEILDLRGNPLPVPPEILGPKEYWEDPKPSAETISFYFSLSSELGSVPLYEAKLILVGESGAGKTSLAKKVDHEDYKLQGNEKSTEGIDVIRWDFTLANGNAFRVNIWDFGGQEIYHATHQFFLTKRSLYLLVADTRQNNTDFYYWLKIVELLSDSSPVLVIKNEKQDRQCQIDEGLFKSQFDSLKDYLPTNLKDNRGLDKIKDAIRYHIAQLSHVGNPLPKIWVRVRAALENYAQNCNTITVERYFEICSQNGFTDKKQMLFLISYLHDLGVCLHFQDDKLLKRIVVLKPEWATTAVYKVTDSDTVRNGKGRFTESDTKEIWADSEYSDLRDELLQLMMRFKLAYELPDQPGHYIAPQLLPLSKPEYDWDATNNLILRYTYDFMPKGILTRFIVETNKLIEYSDTVWQNGVVLSDPYARAEIIENYPKREIVIRVSGTNKNPLLEKARYEFWKIHESYERLQYDELIPCNCEQCKNSTSPQSYPYDLLMKYIGDHRYDIECRGSYKKVDVRRLISDISDDSNRYNLEDGGRGHGQINERFRAYYEQPTVYIDQSTRITDRSNFNQYGEGDNYAGDRVEQDKIGTQINQQDLESLSRAVDTLVADIAEDYNLNKPRVGSKIQRDALERIEEDLDLKQRLTNAIKAGFEETLEQMVKNPFAKLLLKNCQGFLSNE
ncbi:MAG: COR domain-containing protein [Cyanobacteria bacterium P01_D01_bin.105]